jgi:hypothetical protein
VEASGSQDGLRTLTYYVNTASECWSGVDFFRSGDETVANEILTDMENICQGLKPGR